jgi:phytoene synthase
MASDLDSAYEVCRQIAKTEARNFYYAFRTLPSHRRRAIHAIYAFCRLCDDIVDEERTLDEKRRLLAETRDKLAWGRDGAEYDPVFIALKDAADTFGIPTELLEEVIDGVEMDLTQNRYQSFEDLRGYCYKVASTVGLICVEIFGYSDPRVREYAVDLGLGMQLTNILRDMKEDAQIGRIYLPRDDLDSFDYPESDLVRGKVNDAFRGLMAHQVQRARSYLDSGRRLVPLVSPQARACPAVLAGVYGTVLDRIEASGFDVYRERIGLRTGEKILLMAKLWLTSLIPETFPLRK